MPQLIPRTFLLLCAIACLCLLTVHLLPADIRPNVAQLILVIIIPPSTVLTILLLAVLWHFFSTHVHGATSLATIDPGPAHGPPVITAVHASSAQTACDAHPIQRTDADSPVLDDDIAFWNVEDFAHVSQDARPAADRPVAGPSKVSMALLAINQPRRDTASASTTTTHAEDFPWQGMCSWCTDFLLRGIDDTKEDPHIHVPRCRDERDGVVPVMPEYYPTPTPSPTPSEW